MQKCILINIQTMGASSGNDYELNKNLQIQNELLNLEVQRKIQEIKLREAVHIHQNNIKAQQYKEYCQNELDQQYKNSILKYQKYLGYDLDFDEMTSYELEYWSKRIHQEIDQKY